MATTTAVAVIGQSRPHTNGIDPAYILFLTESSRPALQLFKICGDGLRRVATWIPTVDNMIEDLVLMAGAFTGAQPELPDTLHAMIGASLERVEMYTLGDGHRAELYKLSKKSPFRSKMVLTILEESSLVRQSGRICCYQMDCELCLSTRAGVSAQPREVSHA
jgi:hypothetical protein